MSGLSLNQRIVALRAERHWVRAEGGECEFCAKTRHLRFYRTEPVHRGRQNYSLENFYRLHPEVVTEQLKDYTIMCNDCWGTFVAHRWQERHSCLPRPIEEIRHWGRTWSHRRAQALVS